MSCVSFVKIRSEVSTESVEKSNICKTDDVAIRAAAKNTFAHVEKMEDNRILHRVLHYCYIIGNTSRGMQTKTWMDNAQEDLRTPNIIKRCDWFDKKLAEQYGRILYELIVSLPDGREQKKRTRRFLFWNFSRSLRVHGEQSQSGRSQMTRDAVACCCCCCCCSRPRRGPLLPSWYGPVMTRVCARWRCVLYVFV